MSDPTVLSDDYGRKVRVGRTQDGKPFVSITDVMTSVMAVLSGELEAFTEAVVRLGVPGQAGWPRELGGRTAAELDARRDPDKTGECPQPGCTADPATASGGLPPKWCTGDCSHGDGDPVDPTAKQPAAEADATGPFGGHEFAYEPSTDLFRCTRCRA